jgi:hypothetical protein
MDVAVIETGNGGDVQKSGNDLAMVFSGENNVYLGMFGGNLGFLTKEVEEDEQRFYWWGNDLTKNRKSIQFDSRTENLLNTIALNSSGRLKLEDGIKKDLEFMNEFATVDSVEVFILSDDHVQIRIRVTFNNVQSIKIVDFKRSANGDFSIVDFSGDDFLT